MANSAASLTTARTWASIFFNEFLGRKPPLQQSAAHLFDRIVLRAHLVHFFLGPILGRVGHGVAAVAVGQHFENDRAIALAAPLHRLVARGLDGADVHAIDLLAGNVEGPPALTKFVVADARATEVPMP